LNLYALAPAESVYIVACLYVYFVVV